MRTRDWLAALAAFVSVGASGVGSGLAEDVPVRGAPTPWGAAFQHAYSPVMERIHAFHDGLLLPVIYAIAALVVLLLLIVIVRFNARRNPKPARWSHNTLLEFVWTAVPVVILIVIAIPSFKLLYYEARVPESALTLKVTGNQWYWTYEYPDYDGLSFDAVMLGPDELKPGQLRLLDTDNEVVLPVDTNVRVQITASDVLHSWAVPSLGIKTDAIPGRLNETWLRIEKEGLYYGQCSELCGAYHGFMPIKIHAVSKEAFTKWVEKAKEEYAARSTGAVRLAAAGTTPRR